MSNRYTTLRPTSFDDIPLYQPNFEAMDNMLAQQQLEYDTTIGALGALQPDALAPFQEEASNYYNKWVEKSDSLPELFTKDFKTGKRELSKLLREAKKELTDPNSEFRHFANTKKTYIEGVKRIEEAHKKDPVKFNKKYAMNQLNQQLQSAKWNDFYSEGRVQKNFSNPELIPYVDIQKDVVDIIGKIRSDTDTEFTRDIERKLGRGWIEKIKTKETTAEDIQAVTEQLLQHPKYKDQLKVETWFKTQGVDFNEAEKNYVSNLYNQRDNIFKRFDKLPKNKQAIKALQSNLGVTPDGIMGKNTKAAIQSFKDNYDSNLAKSINDPNFSDNVKNNVIKELVTKPYVDVAKGLYSFKEVDRSIQADQVYLTGLKLSQSRANNQAMLKAIQSLVPKDNSEVLVTPNKAFNMDSFKEAKNTASSNLNEAKKGVKSLIESDKVKNLFGTNKITLFEGLPAVEVNKTKDEILNNIEIANKISNSSVPYDKKLQAYMGATGITDPIIASEQYKQITVGGLGRQIGDALNNEMEALDETNRLKEVETSMTTTYFENEGEEQMSKIKKDYDLENMSNKEVISLLMKSKETKVVKEGDNYFTVTSPNNSKDIDVLGRNNVKTPISKEEGEQLIKFTTNASSSWGGTGLISKRAKGEDLLNSINEGINKAVRTNPEYAKSTRSFDIFGGKGSQLEDLTNDIDARIEANGIVGFIQEATGGIVMNFSNEDTPGEVSKPSDLNDITSSVLSTPTGLKVTLRGNKKGKNYSTVINLPSTYKERTLRTLENEAVNAYNSNLFDNYNSLVDAIAAENGAYKNVATFKAVQPNEKLKKSTTFYKKDSNGYVPMKFNTYGEPLDYKYDSNGLEYQVYRGELIGGKPSYLLTTSISMSDGSVKNVVVDNYKNKKNETGYFHDELSDLTTTVNSIEAPKYFKEQTSLERLPKGFTSGIITDKEADRQLQGTLNILNKFDDNIIEE